jgi:hypothetical protein
MALEDAGRNVMLDALGVVATFCSAHSGFPATIGAGNELSGGSPAYIRKAIAWDAAATGSMAKSAAAVVFDIESGDTVEALGLCSAESAGTIYGGADVTTEGPFGAQGTYTVSAFTVSVT